MTPKYQLFLIFMIILQTMCMLYNIVLLTATIINRRNAALPLAYIVLMSIPGILITVFLNVNVAAFAFLTEEEYENYLTAFGAQFSLGATFSYFHSLCISVLMTVNRLAIILNPFSEMFTQRRLFGYAAVIAIVVLISLLIPYFTPCRIIFMLNHLSFISACDPERHPITVFQNQYAILLPFTCMFVNLAIILHLRFARNDTYVKFKKFFTKNHHISAVPTVKAAEQSNLSKIQARRDLIMMRQTVAIAVYLSIYELGAFITKCFPTVFASLPEVVREGYFYFRLESIPMMNFFIYYLETPSTRRMIRRFLNLKNNNDSTAQNATVFTVAQRR
ncbi:G_PROTEIN_RECEP_F1_2 domain-containing protein [Caenorhabditis elegans]|uniref:G_PROTEIN_RECEP_F1_2 domain-containing protein n=1 Tax=Caenorhabditis elegans TaxID=6239 RepID=G5EDU5_CAEEL|nr:G_PROTEIN_RECEP_F1_2 domain-containing protein [Caenorhabditis elegans]CAA94169.3 G_PROTEIN_RECEP_F1_2 domain-containing protein [Caenorhabditis elegans]|eukprot:NP_510216.3 Serpentine Receptor, class XA [Caenorhabditis elegans]